MVRTNLYFDSTYYSHPWYQICCYFLHNHHKENFYTDRNDDHSNTFSKTLNNCPFHMGDDIPLKNEKKSVYKYSLSKNKKLNFLINNRIELLL